MHFRTRPLVHSKSQNEPSTNIPREPSTPLLQVSSSRILPRSRTGVLLVVLSFSSRRQRLLASLGAGELDARAQQVLVHGVLLLVVRRGGGRGRGQDSAGGGRCGASWCSGGAGWVVSSSGRGTATAAGACPVMCQRRRPTALHRVTGCVTHSGAGLCTRNLTTAVYATASAGASDSSSLTLGTCANQIVTMCLFHSHCPPSSVAFYSQFRRPPPPPPLIIQIQCNFIALLHSAPPHAGKPTYASSRARRFKRY